MRFLVSSGMMEIQNRLHLGLACQAPIVPNPAELRVPAEDGRNYIGVLSGQKKTASTSEKNASEAVVKPSAETVKPAADIPKPTVPVPSDRPYEEMTVEELQSAILEKMAKNGPVTDRMMRDVTENIWHDSLVSWVKSFR